MLAAMRLGERRLVVVPTVPMTVAPRCLAHWQAIEPTPPAAAWKRIVSPGFNAIGLAEQILRGEALEHHRGGLLIADAVGHLDQPAGGDQPRLGIGADRRIAVSDAIADFEVGDVGPELFDHAGAFIAEHRRQRQRVDAAAIVGVDEIEADGGLADARFARAGLADGTSSQVRTSGPPALWMRIA